MKKQLLLFFFLFSGTTLGFSQKVVYQYDDAGNRVKRFIQIEASKANKNYTYQADSVIEKTPDFTLKVYPNPTRGTLGVEIQGTKEDETITLMLFSSTGAMLYNRQGNTGLNAIDITSYATGIYILKVKIGEEISEYKIIKQ